MSNKARLMSPVLKSSVLMRDVSPLNAREGDCCCLTRTMIQEGVELQLWEASFATPLQMDIVEDGDAIHFTYVMQGGADIQMMNRRYGAGLTASAGTGVLHFCPGETGCFRQVGAYSCVVGMVRPEVFSGWVDADMTRLGDMVSRGQCLIGGIRGVALQSHARRLFRSLKLMPPADESGQKPCQGLHLQIQGLSFIAAFLDCAGQKREQGGVLSHEDRLRLKKARELLMADLSHAPTLPELARMSGLGLSKLKRGFQVLFGSSVYGLFLRERMQEAYRRLESDGMSVTEVALDMGYSNISHFAAAFRKQFGVNPGRLRRAI